MNQIAQAIPTDSEAPAPPSRAGSDAALAKDATVSDLMSPPVGVFRGTATVAETI